MQARTLPASSGWQWLRGGLLLWRRQPGTLSFATLTAMLLAMIPGALPWVGPVLVSLAAPFLDVVLLHVCRQIAGSEPPALQALRARLVQHGRSLLILGFVMFLGMTLAVTLRDALAGDAVNMMREQLASGQAVRAPGNLLWATLVYAICISLLSVVMWIAPPLCLFFGLPPFKALFFSIVICWRNRGAFVVFGLALLLLLIPVSLPVVLGSIGQALVGMLLFGVVVPACIAANYLSLVDIFGPLPPLDEQ